MTAQERARLDRLHAAIVAALHRYDNPTEPHNVRGGFPRGEVAWAMASDLRDRLEPGDLDGWPDPRRPDPNGNPWAWWLPAE
jgi:hypothetical protein